MSLPIDKQDGSPQQVAFTVVMLCIPLHVLGEEMSSFGHVTAISYLMRMASCLPCYGGSCM
jgi:hypothetical protein